MLLTRTHQGIVLVVPEGNPEEPTRNPAYYDSTYEYLKAIGIREVEFISSVKVSNSAIPKEPKEHFEMLTIKFNNS